MSGRDVGRLKMQGTEAVLRRVLAHCGARPCAGKMRGKAWLLVSGVLVQSLASRGASLRGGEASSARSPRLWSVRHRARRPPGDPFCLTVVVIAAGGGRGPTPLRCHQGKTVA